METQYRDFDSDEDCNMLSAGVCDECNKCLEGCIDPQYDCVSEQQKGEGDDNFCSCDHCGALISHECKTEDLPYENYVCGVCGHIVCPERLF